MEMMAIITYMRFIESFSAPLLADLYTINLHGSKVTMLFHVLHYLKFREREKL